MNLGSSTTLRMVFAAALALAGIGLSLFALVLVAGVVVNWPASFGGAVVVTGIFSLGCFLVYRAARLAKTPPHNSAAGSQ